MRPFIPIDHRDTTEPQVPRGFWTIGSGAAEWATAPVHDRSGCLVRDSWDGWVIKFMDEMQI